MASVKIVSIGRRARKILQLSRALSVTGVTSRGIFLGSSPDQVIFISFESWQGPLTANLGTPLSKKDFPSVGDEADIQAQEIKLGSCVLKLPIEVELWLPPKISLTDLDIRKFLENANKVTALIMEAGHQSPFLPLLRVSSQTVSHKEMPTAVNDWLSDNQPRELIQGRDFLEPWLGYGSGLTPSGDDFICGYLLAAYSLPNSNAIDRQKIIRQAEEKTTSLSAALIREAANGAADERLMTALEFLAGRMQIPLQIKDALLSYGSTSGVDSFAGMLTAITLNSMLKVSNDQGYSTSP